MIRVTHVIESHTAGQVQKKTRLVPALSPYCARKEAQRRVNPETPAEGGRKL